MEDKVEILDEDKKVLNEEFKDVRTPKKKSPIGLIILIIILMCGCLVGGYFINEKGLIKLGSEKETKEEKKKETKKEEKEPVVTNYAVTDAKVAKLIDNILQYKPGVMCGRITLLAMDKKFGVNDIDNDGAWSIAMTDLSGKDKITLDEVSNIIKKYLGKDYKFEPKSSYEAYCSGIYEYDESSKTFNKKPVEGGCGGSCGPAASNYRMVKAVDTDGVLKIDVKVVFGSEGVNNGNQDAFYSDYARTNVIGDANQNSIEDLYDKGADYQFTFKLEDGNYVFVSSEPVK